jgi:hypothetical protein
MPLVVSSTNVCHAAITRTTAPLLRDISSRRRPRPVRRSALMPIRSTAFWISRSKVAKATSVCVLNVVPLGEVGADATYGAIRCPPHSLAPYEHETARVSSSSRAQVSDSVGEKDLPPEAMWLTSW